MEYKRILSVTRYIMQVDSAADRRTHLYFRHVRTRDSNSYQQLVLSNHTGGFKGFTCRDSTSDMPDIFKQMGDRGKLHLTEHTRIPRSSEQIAYVKGYICKGLVSPSGLRIVDPAMADGGKLYPAFLDGLRGGHEVAVAS